jgi:hypothetical protein
MKHLMALVAIAAVTILGSQISEAQVRVMTSGGFAAPPQAVLPEFEKISGRKSGMQPLCSR